MISTYSNKNCANAHHFIIQYLTNSGRQSTADLSSRLFQTPQGSNLRTKVDAQMVDATGATRNRFEGASCEYLDRMMLKYGRPKILVSAHFQFVALSRLNDRFLSFCSVNAISQPLILCVSSHRTILKIYGFRQWFIVKQEPLFEILIFIRFF